MKKFFSVMALVIAIFVCGNASAASWHVVDSDEATTTSVDKDSMKRGTTSAKFPSFNRTDGYSAIVKVEVKIPDVGDIEMVYLASLYTEGGVRKFCLLDGYDGSESPKKASDIIVEDVDTEGYVWPKVWEYIESNLK